MKNKVSFFGSFFLLTILLLYVFNNLSNPVFGEVVFPHEVDQGVFRFMVKHKPVLLHLGVRMPKGELPLDRVLNITIIDEKLKHIILKKQYGLNSLNKMSNTDMNKDTEYDYYSVENIQNIGVLQNNNYLIKIENIGSGREKFTFVVFIRGLFH